MGKKLNYRYVGSIFYTSKRIFRIGVFLHMFSLAICVCDFTTIVSPTPGNILSNRCRAAAQWQGLRKNPGVML